MITASHNPSEYNGYKVYDAFGCQLAPWQTKQVIGHVDAVTDYHTIQFAGDSSLLFMADVTDNFVMAVLKQSRYSDSTAKRSLKIVYTPLHGTGNVPVQKVLRLDGFTQLEAVAEQVNPDGSFPTVVSPNPEDHRALKMGIEQAKRIDADIVLGADIARKHGIPVFSTLTGFKFIGEKIAQFEQAKVSGNKERDYDFLFGYEESYGYLAGTHARDSVK